MTNEEENNWAMFAHLSTFSGYLIPFGNIVGPIVIWQMKKNESEFVSEHGKAALNFQISMLIWMIISLILCLIFIGILLLLALVIVDIIYVIINSLDAGKGKPPKYPLTIQFVK